MDAQMVEKLYERMVADACAFPCGVKLKIGNQLISGVMYEDGTFREGEADPGEGDVAAAG